MAAGTRSIKSFYELRIALQGIEEAARAAQDYMDDNGIAVQSKRGKYKRHNGASEDINGNGPDVETLRSAAKALFGKREKKTGTHQKKKRPKNPSRKQSKRPTTAPEPDGKHVSIVEAAKILGMSDANVRFMAADGRLPKPTWESRTSKGRPDIAIPIQVLLRKDVEAYKEAQKAK